jgi:hypothetical protein
MTNVADLIPFIVIGSALLAGLLWLIRAQISLQREFKPNGGASTRDSLNRIEVDLRELRKRIDDHVEWHLDN